MDVENSICVEFQVRVFDAFTDVCHRSIVFKELKLSVDNSFTRMNMYLGT
jgi:hypothetical protein